MPRFDQHDVSNATQRTCSFLEGRRANVPRPWLDNSRLVSAPTSMLGKPGGITFAQARQVERRVRAFHYSNNSGHGCCSRNAFCAALAVSGAVSQPWLDRKSTRLNSSHVANSYA